MGEIKAVMVSCDWGFGAKEEKLVRNCLDQGCSRGEGRKHVSKMMEMKMKWVDKESVDVWRKVLMVGE